MLFIVLCVSLFVQVKDQGFVTEVSEEAAKKSMAEATRGGQEGGWALWEPVVCCAVAWCGAVWCCGVVLCCVCVR